MEKDRIIPIQDIMTEPYAERKGLLLSTFTGIESSQLAQLTPEQQQKVFLGLHKQFDLAVSLHGPSAKDALRTSLNTFFMESNPDVARTAEQVNSLLVFGDIRDLEGTGVEHMHDRLSHFWRILGWEELHAITDPNMRIKYPAGSIEPVMKSCGNLIRTLDLLAERWGEFGVGPQLIYPSSETKTKRETAKGFSVAKIGNPYTNITAIVTGRNEVIPTDEMQQDYKQQLLLLEGLLARFPVEFAYAIFDYYIFTQNMNKNAYNVAVLQEYAADGKHYVKGLWNGKVVLLHGALDGQTMHHNIIASSKNDSVAGAPYTSLFATLNTEVEKGHLMYIHGELASVILGYPDIISTFDAATKIDPKKKVTQFYSAIGKAKYQKPIIVIPTGNVVEGTVEDITDADVESAAHTIASYLTENGIRSVNIEAAHIHADTVPTGRQKKGMNIGAQLVSSLEKANIAVDTSVMIDDDHVPNTLDHHGYIETVKEHGYNPNEVIYESSPVTREIAVAAMASLAELHPNNFHTEGDTLIFDIPGTELQVELIKDIKEEPFDLGCVIFDVALTLYKLYPELASLYSSVPGSEVHAGMSAVFDAEPVVTRRHDAAILAYPLKTQAAGELQTASPLPALPNEKAAIINILEGFYSPQQVKLQAMLDALGTNIAVIGVNFSRKSLQTNIPK